MLLAPADIANDMRFPVGSKGLTVMFAFPDCVPPDRWARRA